MRFHRDYESLFRSTELNTFGMANTIYRDFVWRETGGNLSVLQRL